MNIKQKILLLLCKTIYKPIQVNKFDKIRSVRVEKKCIKAIENTTFNVLEINIDGNKKYFRECRKHLTFNKYLEETVKDYFYFYTSNEKFIKNKHQILKIIINKKTIKKIYNMGIANNPKSLTAQFFLKKDLSILGLENLSNINITDLLDFIQYLWGEVYAYRLNEGLKIGNFQTFNSSKVIATKKLADLLQLDILIPKVEMVRLIIDDRNVKFGTLMDSVNGISPSILSVNEKLNVTPNFQKQCNSLNILDALINEKDHRPGNYYVKIKEKRIDSLQAFDNDSPMAFFLTKNINLITYWDSGPLINKKGIIALNQLDKRLVEKIQLISKEDIYNTFTGIITNIQIFFLWKRIEKMKTVLKKTIRLKRTFLFEDKDWNEKTIDRELKDDNNTYLTIFCKSEKKEKNYDMKNDR